MLYVLGLTTFRTTRRTHDSTTPLKVETDMLEKVSLRFHPARGKSGVLDSFIFLVFFLKKKSGRAGQLYFLLHLLVLGQSHCVSVKYPANNILTCTAAMEKSGSFNFVKGSPAGRPDTLACYSPASLQVGLS